MNALNELFSAHARARRAIDEQLDAERDGQVWSEDASARLQAHLAGCEECRQFQAQRRALLQLVRSAPTLSAPTGFSGRVMLAAKARGRVKEEAPRSVGLRWAWAGAAALGVVIAFAVTPVLREPERAPRIEVSGVGAELPAPQFQVRAVGVGPARAKASVRGIVEGAGGTVLEDGAGLYARIPRAALVGVLQALAKQGSYKVVQATPGELDPELEEIGISFQVE